MDILRAFELRRILLDGGDGRPGGRLVELIAQRAAVQTVDPEETRLVGKRAAGIVREEFRQVGLGGVEILVAVIAQAPVILHRVVPRRPGGKRRKGFEQLGGLLVLLGIEIRKGGVVFGVRIVAGKQRIELALAREQQ